MKYSNSTHYDTLRIKQSATMEEIKNAYIQSCKDFHPDVNNSPEASEQFRKAREAYGVLSNSNSKIHYDYEISNLSNINPYDEEELEVRSPKRDRKPMDHVAERAVMQR